MPIKSYNELKKSTPAGAAYVVDTCFLLRAAHPDSEEHSLKAHLVKKDVLLAYNVTVKHEVLHQIRPLIFEAILKRDANRFTPQVIKFWTESLPKLGYEGNEALKQIAPSGYIDLFKEVFGENGELLIEEEAKTFAGCTYVSTKDFPVALDWNTTVAMMAVYGLNSSDAMILNFAASNSSYNGVISADGDFLYCSEDLEIVLPKSRAIPGCKPCLPGAVNKVSRNHPVRSVKGKSKA